MNPDRDYIVRVMPVDGEAYNAVWSLPDRDSPRFHTALKAHVAQVTGDQVEHVRVFADFFGGNDFKYLDMFVNELGHITGLPLNVMATAIYQHNVKYHEPNVQHPDMPTIVGPAVLFEEIVWR